MLLQCVILEEEVAVVNNLGLHVIVIQNLIIDRKVSKKKTKGIRTCPLSLIRQPKKT